MFSSEFLLSGENRHFKFILSQITRLSTERAFELKENLISAPIRGIRQTFLFLR